MAPHAHVAVKPFVCLPGALAAGLKFALPKLVNGITRQLFLEDSPTILSNFLGYREEEFVGVWPRTPAESENTPTVRMQ